MKYIVKLLFHKNFVFTVFVNLIFIHGYSQTYSIKTGTALGNSIAQHSYDYNWVHYKGTYNNTSEPVFPFVISLENYHLITGNATRWITRNDPTGNNLVPPGYYTFEHAFFVTSSTTAPTLDVNFFSGDNLPTKIVIDGTVFWPNSNDPLPSLPTYNFSNPVSLQQINLPQMSQGTHKIQVEVFNEAYWSSLFLDATITGVQGSPTHNIAGIAWNDVDAEGDYDSNNPFEALKAGVTVGLYSGGTLVSGVANNPTTTDGFGNYMFQQVPVGTYTVQATTPSYGWVQTLPVSNGSYSITVSSSSPQTITGNDFGFHYTCCSQMDLDVDLPVKVNCPGYVHNLNYTVGCANSTTLTPTYTYSINFGDGSSPVTTASGTHTYPSTEATYTVTLTATPANTCPTMTTTQTVIVYPCVEPCANCVGPFAPEAGDYLIGFWVKEDQADQVPYYYSGAILSFYDSGNTQIGSSVSVVAPSSDNIMIEGWQRVEGKFTVPSTAYYMKIELNNASSTVDTYFDDIRIHPMDASLKSYVYDPVNLRLMAELDENNFATFYEYDEEGKLVRVKKETEKGVMTIKESRNKTSVK